jgi:hypothetical protein
MRDAIPYLYLWAIGRPAGVSLCFVRPLKKFSVFGVTVQGAYKLAEDFVAFLSITQ